MSWLLKWPICLYYFEVAGTNRTVPGAGLIGLIKHENAIKGFLDLVCNIIVFVATWLCIKKKKV